MSDWYLYVVRASDGTLYTGIATDVARRLEEHRAGPRGARYLRGRGPLELAYECRMGERAAALRAESRLKRLPKPDKEALLAASPDRRGLLERLELGEGGGD